MQGIINGRRGQSESRTPFLRGHRTMQVQNYLEVNELEI